MTQYLPPNLLALFAPRDPIPYMPPMGKLPHEKKLRPYTGVSENLSLFEDPKDTPPPTRVETKEERKERKRKERAEQVAYQLEQDLALWDPTNDPKLRSDPFKTLFIARINFDTSESKLRREFEDYGPIRSINYVMATDSGKPRGYAFIEYEHERDMHSAYKHADGKKIDGRRVLVDIERGRTIKGWRPRRLGGGLGGTRKGGPDVNTKFSGRDDANSNARDERDRSRERDTAAGENRRRRSRSRSKPRRPRSRSRSRERPVVRRRSRSREPRPKREEDVVNEVPLETNGVDEIKQERGDRVGGDRVGGDRVGGDRVGGDRVGGDRVGGDRDRDRDRRRRRDRSRDRSRRSRSREGGRRRRDPDRIKKEKKDDFDTSFIKAEKTEDDDGYGQTQSMIIKDMPDDDMNGEMFDLKNVKIQKTEPEDDEDYGSFAENY